MLEALNTLLLMLKTWFTLGNCITSSCHKKEIRSCGADLSIHPPPSKPGALVSAGVISTAFTG